MGPLAGIRILDFTHVLAGPFCTRLLADMGADVVKIVTDTRPVAAGGPDHPYFAMWNRNKRLLQLDLSRGDAREAARQMALRADIVVDNFSVGVLDRWNIGYDAVAPLNPGVIYMAMSGMGQTGPWSSYVTYAPTVHALAGLTYLTGVRGRSDIGIGFSYNDHMAGLHGAFALLAALEHRRRTGRGQSIDMSQFEVGVGFSGPALLDYFANGNPAGPVANDHPWDRLYPQNCFPCHGNEHWIAIAIETDDQWRNLVAEMGSPDWAADPALENAETRWRRRGDIYVNLAIWTVPQDRYELMHRLQTAGIPAGTVQTGEDLTQNDPQLKHAQMHFTYSEEHPALGKINGDRLVPRFAKTPTTTYNRPQTFNESNAQITQDWLNWTPEETAQAQQNGLIA